MIPVGTNLKLKRIPLATISLLAANWLIFMFLRLDDYKTNFWVSRYLFFVPGDQYPWQLVTSMFLHADFSHLIWNSIFLSVFGSYAEDKVGWKAYLFFYSLTGIAASLVQGMVTGFLARTGLFIPSLGASGAISGIMGVYLYRCYYSKIRLLLSLPVPIPLQIPAVAVIGFWFLKDLAGGVGSLRGAHADIAFWAHIGGFIAGLGACKYLRYEVEAKREKMELVARKADLLVGYGEGIEACEKLIQADPGNPELHLKLARAKSRWRASQEGAEHYEKAVKLLLRTDPKRAAKVFIEYWTKHLKVMEARYQVALSRTIHREFDADFAAKALHALIESGQPPDLYMERAYLDLGRIYESLGREDLARHVYGRLVQTFPASKHRQFAEKKLHSGVSGVNP